MTSSFLSQDVPLALEPPASGVRILSIDGGGMRGIIALEFLKIIEKRLCQPVRFI
jgi:patatin-like phospholipase/acyl hydrolase